MIKLLIFDLDGTLVNAYPAIIQSVNATLKKLGFPPQSNRVIKRAVGMGDKHLVTQFVGEKLAHKATQLYRANHKKAIEHGVGFLPGARPLLQWAKRQGLLVAIATNRPAIFTKKILKTLKASQYFDKVLCADEISRPKPYPDILLKVCKDLKVSKKEALFIGDMLIDLKCGANAGILTVAVPTGSNEKNELKELKPYKIIDRISQLKDLIKVHNKGVI